MNKKILIIAVVFLAMAILATPVMAVPIKGQKVPAILTVTELVGFAPPTKDWITNGGINQFRELYQPHSFILNIGDQDFTGHTDGFDNGKIDLEKNTLIIRAQAVYLVDGKDGGFVGIVHLKAYNFRFGAPATWDWEVMHLVAQGFGDFEGQTLMVSYEGIQGGSRIGYCLKG